MMTGLKSFQDIKALFNLPGTSFFMYLHIRSVFRAYGVPWDAQLPVHPLQKVILPTDNSVILLQFLLFSPQTIIQTIIHNNYLV